MKAMYYTFLLLIFVSASFSQSRDTRFTRGKSFNEKSVLTAADVTGLQNHRAPEKSGLKNSGISGDMILGNFSVIDSVLVYSNNSGNGKYTYDFDSDGNKLVELFRKFSNGSWENRSRFTSTFDARGNELTHLQEYWTDNAWVGQSRYTYTYNSADQLLVNTYENYDKDLGKWVIQDKRTSVYDNNGNLTSYLYEKFKNEAVSEGRRWTYTFDPNNNKLGELSENLSGGNWTNDAKNSFTYDQNDNKLSELFQNWENNEWSNDKRYTYSYNTKNNMTGSLFEKWQADAWVSVSKHTRSYDDNSNILTDLSEVWIEDVLENYTKEIYTYTQNGLLSSHLKQNWCDGKWADYTNETGTWDADSNLVCYLYEQWSTIDGSLSTRLRFNYTYDKFGNTLAELYEQLVDNKMENVYRKTYEFDEDGNCSAGRYELWADGAWTDSDEQLMFREKTSGYYSFNGYRIKVFRDGMTAVEDPAIKLLTETSVAPNPFTASATMTYETLTPGMVTIEIFNSIGEKVETIVNEFKEPGAWQADVRSGCMPSGVYFYTVRSGDGVRSGRMVVSK